VLSLSSIFAIAGSGSGDIRLAFWATIGAVGGVVLFIRGFVMLRYKRLIQNTPASKIRSASMGLVELSGMAEGPQTIPAGITGEACFYYRAIAWQLKESGRSNEWKKVADESLFVPFFINDMTGRMLVDAAGADMEVQRNFRDEFNSSFFGSRDMLPENVGRFLARNGILGGAAVRLEERCIKPAYPLFVFGTLAPRSLTGQTGWVPKPHVGGSSVMGMDVSLDASRLRAPLGNNVAQLLGRIPGAERASVSKTSGTFGNPAPAAMWSSVSINEVSLAHSGGHAAVAEAPVEPVEQPAPQTDEEAETPKSQFDLSQPVAIGKGADGAPFMISSESQRELVKALGWKSALCIWGGPILALISMYYLLVYFELT